MNTEARTWSRRAVAISGSVYGTILASSIVVALGYQGGDALVMITALIVTELVFALAHAWSTLLATGADRGGLPSPGDVGAALRYERPVLQATWPAVLALSLAALGAYSSDTGVDVALVANAVILFLWGFALARQQGASTALAVAAGAFTCLLGVALVVLKVLVHKG